MSPCLPPLRLACRTATPPSALRSCATGRRAASGRASRWVGGHANNAVAHGSNQRTGMEGFRMFSMLHDEQAVWSAHHLKFGRAPPLNVFPPLPFAPYNPPRRPRRIPRAGAPSRLTTPATTSRPARPRPPPCRCRCWWPSRCCESVTATNALLPPLLFGRMNMPQLPVAFHA